MNERERQLLQQLGRTARAMHAAFEADVGQALPRWRILQSLSDTGEASQKELARQLAMDPASMTRLMKALEADGLVRRQSDPDDNRRTMVCLTPNGTKLVRDKQPLRQAFSKKALRGVPAEQVDQAMALLQTLEERFRR